MFVGPGVGGGHGEAELCLVRYAIMMCWHVMPLIVFCFVLTFPDTKTLIFMV
jgi:hypothetical protein